MIRIENQSVTGIRAAIRGMRNPLNSWDQSDSFTENDVFFHDEVGEKDKALMMKLVSAGTDHRKFLRFIHCSFDLVAPLYWWKEFDTYKVGTAVNSCSTMHTIHKRDFTLDDFSHEHLFGTTENILIQLIEILNRYRGMYENDKLLDREEKKQVWWQMIQLLPTSYNQRRTVDLNYEVLRNIYHARKGHKLDEWRDLCKWIETLPCSYLITEG